MSQSIRTATNDACPRCCEFDFLGYTFGRIYSAKTGQPRMGMRPSKKSIRRMVEKVHALTALKTGWQETTAMVGKLNRMLRGWANYFKVGTVMKSPSTVELLERPLDASSSSSDPAREVVAVGPLRWPTAYWCGCTNG